MVDQLLVRMYNVNLGDFIYLRVPDTNRDVHILVDCGTLSAMDVLTNRLEELKTDLPQDEAGKWQIDLLVVSHPHLDHHKGFTPEHFDSFSIKNLWLSPAYDRHNPQATGFFALKDATLHALTSLSGFTEGQLKIEVDGLLEMDKSEIIQHLCSGMGQGITPRFVSADTPSEDLTIFKSEDIHLKILSPMSNIDGYYMGGTGLDISHAGTNLGFSFGAESMSLEERDHFSKFLVEGYDQLYKAHRQGEPAVPQNISALDYVQLQNRLRSNALALAEMTGKIENNLSLVLLLEWHGLRLLFPGDAEWSSAYKGAVKDGKCNGAWNVMWKERKADLSLPLDFLKVGHHGSENATPWSPKKENKPEQAINQILDAMLPPDRSENAVAIVSTERTNRYPSIPDGKLLIELAKRVKNVQSDYIETSTSDKNLEANTPQPQRTDLELSMTGESGPYIEKYFYPQEDFD
jgi:beta-lactamase superfamily II metal-dependent hydrolase